MQTNRAIFWIVLLTVVLFTLPFSAGARPEAPAAATAPVTVITVDSGTDPDNSKSKTCSNDTPCTLRRAIVEARLLDAASRPVLIEFNIPAMVQEGYDSALEVWVIEILGAADAAVFRDLAGGQITIDGSTQPGGREDGPKIILLGPATGNKDGLIVGTNNAGSHDGNVVSGLGFQNFKNHLIVNSNENEISQNWFGLTSDGSEPFLRNGDAQDGSGSSGVALSAGASANLITENVFLGLDGVAAAIRGDQNTFSDNLVGTNAAGNAPEKETDPTLWCSKVDWLGGGGISMEGDDHVIEGNRFAALRQDVFASSTQPDAVRITGTGHTIKDNIIGVSADSTAVGVCGRGLFMADSPQGVLLQDNVIVNPGLSAISLNGPLYDANELRGNTISQEKPWSEVEGNPQPEDAIQLGPLLPDALQAFAPAQVTSIEDTMVSGTSGAASPCPNCTIEVFLDDGDAIAEALQSLAVVNADSNGDWQTVLPRPLAEDEGLRTTSTSSQFNTISGLSASTTTGLSGLYVRAEEIPLAFLPLVMGE
ncbi:MAG: hypothetical protein ACK2UK_16810 [Candidatus Promineifilaceae bacterium]